jgi:hypothetical protein
MTQPSRVRTVFRTPLRWFQAAMILLLISGAAFTRADPDLWGHVRFGIDTLEARHLTATDPYSFTQDIPWVNHEWLSEVQMGAAYATAGNTGLCLLKAILVVGPLLLVWRCLGGARVSAKIVVVILFAMGTLHMWATVRPQLWTLLCLTLLCWILIADRPTRLRWLPPIFVVWVNCHGGWIVGLGVLVAWATGSILRRPREALLWSAVVAACIISTLVNPYGWRLWEFVGRTVRMTRSISEWEPLWVTPPLNWLPWFAACAATVWSGWPSSRADAFAKSRVFMVLVALAFASARVMRMESLFVCASAILLAPWVRTRWPAPSRRIDISLPVQNAFVTVAAVAALALAAFSARRSLACVRVLGDWVPDEGSAEILERAQPGRLVVFFDWGEYALWHFGPDLKVSIDGRRETVYSDARLVEHDAIVAGSPVGLATLETWRAEYVWLPSKSLATKQWLQANGYRVEADTPRSFVAVRADLPRLPVQGSRPGADCFPQ